MYTFHMRRKENDLSTSHYQYGQKNDGIGEEYGHKSYSERVDPIISLKSQYQKSSNFGFIAALELESKKYCSYEIYMFVEDNLGCEIDDLSIFRDSKEKPTGTVIIRFKQKITIQKLSQLNNIKFKGKSLNTKLFYTPEEYHDYVQHMIDNKLKQIYLPFRVTMPLVCVAGFDVDADEDQLKEIFSNAGTILLIEKFRDLFMIYYSDEKSALFANRLLNHYTYKGNEIRVTLFYPKNVQRTFGIRGCKNYKFVINTIHCFGKIEHSFCRDDGSVFVLMENMESAKASCLTLNMQKIEGNYIQTYFITYPEYQVLSSES